uniref:Uncharacterized protein n=1 Tax=Arundo donax TaxID=35708 RepID=A0A0A8YG07_ARUDO
MMHTRRYGVLTNNHITDSLKNNHITDL